MMKPKELRDLEQMMRLLKTARERVERFQAARKQPDRTTLAAPNSDA